MITHNLGITAADVKRHDLIEAAKEQLAAAVESFESAFNQCGMHSCIRGLSHEARDIFRAAANEVLRESGFDEFRVRKI